MPTDDKPLSDTRKGEETLDKLHELLPDDVNRRRFLQSTATIVAGTTLAGCIGGESNGNDSGETGGDDGESDTQQSSYPDSESVIFRNSYKDEPFEAHAYAADFQGFWEDVGIKSPEIKTGQGSADTSRRLGPGDEEFGIASLIPQIQGMAEGYDIKLLSGAKSVRTMLALLYRKDMLSSSNPEDLQGKTVLTAAALDQNTLQLYLKEKDMSPDDMNMKVAEHQSQFALLSEGEGAAMWGQIPNVPSAQSALPDDVELGVDVFYQYKPIYGYGLSASTEMLNRSGGEEYARKLLEGMSAAAKWIMFNPEETGQLMVDNVNPALQTRSADEMAGTVKGAIIAPSLTEETTTEGILALAPEKLSSTFDFVGTAFDVDTPNYEDFWAKDIHDQTEFATLSDSEYEEVMDIGQPFTGLFEGESL